MTSAFKVTLSSCTLIMTSWKKPMGSRVYVLAAWVHQTIPHTYCQAYCSATIGCETEIVSTWMLTMNSFLCLCGFNCQWHESIHEVIDAKANCKLMSQYMRIMDQYLWIYLSNDAFIIWLLWFHESIIVSSLLKLLNFIQRQSGRIDQKFWTHTLGWHKSISRWLSAHQLSGKSIHQISWSHKVNLLIASYGFLFIAMGSSILSVSSSVEPMGLCYINEFIICLGLFIQTCCLLWFHLLWIVTHWWLPMNSQIRVHRLLGWLWFYSLVILNSHTAWMSSLVVDNKFVNCWLVAL